MKRNSTPPIGSEAVLALVALGKIDAASAQFYGRALAHLGRQGLIERTPEGGYRVAPSEDAGTKRPTPIPPPPQLETVVSRIPADVLEEIRRVAAERGSSISEVAREAISFGLRHVSGSGLRKATRAS